MITSEKTLKTLGIIPSAPPKKLIPKGKDYMRVRKIVKMVNKRFCPLKPKFVGFFPNIKNKDDLFYIVTSDYDLHFSIEYRKFQLILAKIYPTVNVKYEHLHNSTVYFLFKNDEGIYIS